MSTGSVVSADRRALVVPAPPPLGVGITYSASVEPLVVARPDLIDILEFEPQTTWIKPSGGAGAYRPDERVLDRLEALPGRVLVHSVGAPVGGTVRPEPAQIELLREVVRRFGSPWASEHLSFNHTTEFATGFFLPPRQTEAGVRAAVQAIRDLQEGLGVPVCVETGVSYLRPRPDELSDGAFVARVVEEAGCGLLLDLHNVFTNSLNGRQPIDRFLEEIPLERVWEVHLAGGFEADGFYLDAHSGAIPDALLAVAERLMPRLHAVGAIVFEVFPSFVPLVGLKVVEAQLERLRALWRLRPERTSGALEERRPVVSLGTVAVDPPPPAAWEEALGSLVVGRSVPAENVLGDALTSDPAIRLVEGLIHEFRASMVVGVLRLTVRLLMLALGPAAFRTILRDYWAATPPLMYANREAEAFAAHLDGLGLRVPHLAAVLAFERAVLQTLVDGQIRVVRFEVEPIPLLRALADGRLPETPPEPGDFEIEITPDTPDSLGTALGA